MNCGKIESAGELAIAIAICIVIVFIATQIIFRNHKEM
jgi:hypothetical protein